MNRPAPTLTGKRVRLRQAQESDVVPRLRWRLDEEVQRYDGRPMPRTITEVEAITANFLASYRRHGFNPPASERVLYMITIPRAAGAPELEWNTDAPGRVNDRPIGMISYFGFTADEREVQLGILIGEKDCWGKGYASDAVWTVLGELFGATGLQRVTAETRADNQAAVRLFEHCGFREAGRATKRAQDGEHLWLTMELVRSEFLGQGE
ncbi:MAG: GNAT family N-acetyltransferase [Chloroflexota bacterium]